MSCTRMAAMPFARSAVASPGNPREGDQRPFATGAPVRRMTATRAATTAENWRLRTAPDGHASAGMRDVQDHQARIRGVGYQLGKSGL